MVVYKILIFLLSIIPLSGYSQDIAQSLFSTYKEQIYQIRVIDIGSSNKSSIGSGFLVDQSGIIASNYHVVSDYILEPERYRIELVDHEDNIHDVELVNFDIVHDLALLKSTFTTQQEPLKFATEALNKGNRIYSLGNPHDLGQTIIEGTYNGLVEHSRYKRYLFSGSLNSGMSGGPAVNRDGRVIGINVSKGGEQISFLVPVSHLIALVKTADEQWTEDQYKVHITRMLINDQNEFYNQLLTNEWVESPFHRYILPGDVDQSLKCWGHTLDEEKNNFKSSHRHCRTEQSIFIHGDLFTGTLSYDYELIEADDLNSIQFSNYLQHRFKINNSSYSDDDDLTGYVCQSNFVDVKRMKWKIATCIREYFDYRGLYDVVLKAVRVDQKDQSLLFSLKSYGISTENIRDLHSMFMSKIQWK